MKEHTPPKRKSMSLSNLLDTLFQQEKPPVKSRPEKGHSTGKHERLERKEISYYLKALNYDTRELVGYLVDISSGGFKLDCQNPVPINQDIRFRINLTSEVSEKQFILFVARSKWCKVDPLDPFAYNVGFQLTQISPVDLEIFKQIMEKYGKEQRRVDLRRSNRW